MTAIHYPEPDFVEAPEAPPLAVVEPARTSRLPRTPTIIGVALLLAVAAAAVVWIGGGRSDPTAINAPGLAEMYVRAYLTQSGDGNEAAIAPFLGYEPSMEGMEPGSFYVAGATAITVSDLGNGRSSVVVAVEQMGAVDGGFAPEGIHYYEVTLEASDGHIRATSLPAQIVAPDIGTDVASQPVFASPSETAIGAAIEDYLSWYLADGEGAYAGERPGEALYDSITVTGVAASADADEADVTVAAIDRHGRTVHLQYRLTVTNENGMWVAGPKQ